MYDTGKVSSLGFQVECFSDGGRVLSKSHEDRILVNLDQNFLTRVFW